MLGRNNVPNIRYVIVSGSYVPYKKNKKKNFERSIFDEIAYLKEKSKGHVKDAKEVFGTCLLISSYFLFHPL